VNPKGYIVMLTHFLLAQKVFKNHAFIPFSFTKLSLLLVYHFKLVTLMGDRKYPQRLNYFTYK
jgi:hypothetical protein